MNTSRYSRPQFAVLVLVVLSMVVAGLALPTADAAGPPYSGPETQSTGPAYFGPAPNDRPYCDNPTYFDPFPENVDPIGRIDVTGAPNASVTTNGITMTFELTNNGADDVYPGFFPQGADGGPGDQPKGVEMAAGDAATIVLSEPLFYTQWVFTDVDQSGEGFFVNPIWSNPATPGQVAVFGGDANFDFTGTTQTEAFFTDTDAVPTASEQIEGRAQVDLLGPATGVSVRRDDGNGQSGFAIGGGCEPIGVAKELTSPPTWNGTSFDATYTIRVRNNLPSATTLAADVTQALDNAASGTTSGDPVGIVMQNVTLQDLLTDPAFSAVTVVSNVNTSGNVVVNDNYNGDDDVELLAAGETIPPETEEEFVLTVQYTPAAAGPLGLNCAQPYVVQNQAVVGGVADGVAVTDESDNGTDPDPGVDNGNGDVDDPTPVPFDCVEIEPVSLEIVKTVLAGSAATCPDFASGTPDDGTALNVEVGDTVTYCISVRNPGASDVTGVVVSDPQAPATFDGDIGTLAAGAEAAISFDLQINDTTPERNIASVTGDDPAGGQLTPVEDPAIIAIADPPPLQAAIALSKTVLAGADADCATAVEGADEFILGTVGDPITWCFAVVNTGELPLTNVLFTDAPAGIADLDLLAGETPPVLSVGASLVFAENGVIPAGGVDNVASVVADPSTETGDPIPDVDPVGDDNTAAVNEAALELAKTIAAGADADCATASEVVTVNAGSDVTYCFTISNTGGVTVRVEQVDDLTLGITVPVPAAAQDIAPGTSVVVAYSTIASGDLVNTATVTGVPIDETTGEPIPDVPPLQPQDPAEVDVLEANLSLVKSNTGNDAVLVGNIFGYELTVTNTGPDPALDVVVVDTLPAELRMIEMPDVTGWDCTAAGQVMTCDKLTALGVGESARLEYLVQVLAAAQPGDVLTNTASASSSTPDPDPTDNEDTETTTVDAPPAPQLPPDETLPIVTISNPPPVPGVPANPTPTPPAPPLALTGGAYSRWLILASAAMTSVGGLFFVAGRRRSDQAL